MRPQLLSPDLSRLLLQAHDQREAIEREARINADAHRELRNGRIQGSESRINPSEFADPRRRNLCEAEMSAARDMGLIT